MALSRTPTTILVNGVSLIITGGPDITGTTALRVPGIANFTMPDEVGSTTETQLQDGSVAAAQAAGVGSITGNIGAIGAHPAHQYLEARKTDQEQITVAVVRPAVEVQASRAGNIAAATTGVLTAVDINNGLTAKALIEALRESQLIAIGASGATLGGGFVGISDSPSSANQNYFRAIESIDTENDKVKVRPGYSTAIAAGATNIYTVRSSGLRYEGIVCTVAGLGSGDFQAGGNVNSNITLQPVSAVVRNIEYRTLDELASGNAYGNVFSDL